MKTRVNGVSLILAQRVEEQIRCLVAVSQEGRFGGVPFAENDVSADTKPCVLPRCEEQIDLRPA